MADHTIIHHRLLNQQILTLPHKQDGTINYAILGNMLSASLLGEVLEVSYIDKQFGKPKELLIETTESNWEFSYKENDVCVFKKKYHNMKTHSFMGRGIVDVPMHRIAEYLHKFHNRLEWDDFLTQIEICKCISENDWLYYMAHEATHCLFTSRRDFFLYTRTAFVDNKYIQTSLSVENKDYPHRPPYIRAEIMEGSGWVLEKYEGSECRTLISYAVNMDLKELPTTIMDKILKRQPMAIHHIRNKLTKQYNMTLSLTESSHIMNTMAQVPHLVNTMYEDTVPINHYTSPNKDDGDSTTDMDPDMPMYPWVPERRRMLAARKKDDKPNNSSATIKTQSSPRPKRSNSISSANSSSVSSAGDDNVTDDKTVTITDAVVDNVVTASNDASNTVFPSFSTWTKDQ